MLKLTIFLFVITVVWGAVISDIKDDGYCAVLDLKFKMGETVPAPIGKCQDYTCHDSRINGFSSSICPEPQLGSDSKCHQDAADLSKPYPDCCPSVVCPEE